MGKNIKILRLLTKNFGFKPKYILIICLRGFVNIFSAVTRVFDKIFFPGSNKIIVKNPIFLIGHPRSGTTFLHRFLEKNVPEVKGMYLWEMLFPSITSRKLLRPFQNSLKKISLDKIWKPEIHETGLFEAETEDIVIFLKYFDGFLAWLYFYVWDEYKSQEDFENTLRSKCNQDVFIDYIGHIHQKNLYNNDKRMFSKSFAMVFNLDSILRAYPDGKILLMIRDPKQSISSFMSLLTNAQNAINGLNEKGDDFHAKYYESVYRTSMVYHRIVHEKMQGHLKNGNLMLITHKQLLGDFENVINDVLGFYGIEVTGQIKDKIKEQSEKQTTFKSEHKYTLSQFGIPEDRFENDFKFIYDNYPVR